jgi:hypothetical protein
VGAGRPLKLFTNTVFLTATGRIAAVHHPALTGQSSCHRVERRLSGRNWVRLAVLPVSDTSVIVGQRYEYG